MKQTLALAALLALGASASPLAAQERPANLPEALPEQPARPQARPPAWRSEAERSEAERYKRVLCCFE